MSKEKRRSPRRAIRVFLLAGWKVGEETIVCNAATECINAHGALLKLMSECPPGDGVTLLNVVNQEEQQARVVMAKPDGEGAGTYTLRVEFEAPAPQFWGRLYSLSPEDLETLYRAEGVLESAPRRRRKVKTASYVN